MTDFQTAVTGLKLYTDRIARAVVLVETLVDSKWSEGRALDCLAALDMLDSLDSTYVFAVSDVFEISIPTMLARAQGVLSDKVAAWTPKAEAKTHVRERGNTL